jgi:hypothetical protein
MQVKVIKGRRSVNGKLLTHAEIAVPASRVLAVKAGRIFAPQSSYFPAQKSEALRG